MPSRDPAVSTFLPLREPTLFILLSLAGGEKHGYAIIKTVEDLSGGKLRLSTGTLYEALARLLEQELIERVDSGAAEPAGAAGAAVAAEPAAAAETVNGEALEGADGSPRGRRRKAYRLTDLGRRILAAEAARMRDLVAIARAVLGSEMG